MVLPAVAAVTIPPVFTVAIVGLLLLQLPPVPVVVSVVLLPTHMLLLPLTTPETGAGLTVILCVAVAVPQLLMTV